LVLASNHLLSPVGGTGKEEPKGDYAATCCLLDTLLSAVSGAVAMSINVFSTTPITGTTTRNHPK